MPFNTLQFAREYEAAERDRMAECRRSGVYESGSQQMATTVQGHHRVPKNAALEAVADGFRKKQLRPEDFSIRAVFEETVTDRKGRRVGRELVNSWQGTSAHRPTGVGIYESGVNTAAFANITNQIVYTAMMEEMQKPEFIGMSLVKLMPSRRRWEKIAGMTHLGDHDEEIKEGHDYPTVGLSEDWVTTPETKKYGKKVEVTREAIFFDETGLIVSRAQEGGYYLAVNREKRILDTVFGITNTYNRKNRGVINTYGDTSGRGFDNLAASNALDDYTAIKAVIDLFQAMTDPQDGEPIVLGPNVLICPKSLEWSAKAILAATEIRELTNSGNRETIVSGNRLPATYEIKTNEWVRSRTSSDTTWFYGDPRGAFAYVENWAPESVQAPANNQLEFDKDIALQFKVSEMGTMAVLEPRKMVKSTG